MFDRKLYCVLIENIMVKPQYIIDPSESMENIVKKFDESHKYNIPVVKDGKYIGYLSRAKVFTTYQETLREISAD